MTTVSQRAPKSRLSNFLRQDKNSVAGPHVVSDEFKNREDLDKMLGRISTAPVADEASSFDKNFSRLISGQDDEDGGSVERSIAYFGLLLLAMAIVGDTTRLIVERISVSYEKQANGEALVTYRMYVFMLSVASIMAAIGSLGLVLLFTVSAQVNYVSRVILHTGSVTMMRAFTSDERQLVRMALECGSGRQDMDEEDDASAQ